MTEIIYNSRRNFLNLVTNSIIFSGSLFHLDTEAKEVKKKIFKKNQIITQLKKKQIPYNFKKKNNDKIESILRINDNSLEDLEFLLKTHLLDLKKRGVILSIETPGFLIYDVDNSKQIVGINEDKPFQCASMVKPFVALAFFDMVQKGQLEYTISRQHEMAKMIQNSNNNSTNYFFDLVGGPKIVQEILLTNYSNLFSSLKIVENIPLGGRTYLNRASPQDYNNFLCALWKKELPYSKEIMYHMSEAKKGRNIGGTRIPFNQINVYNKTGTTAMLYGDMGLFNINFFGINKTYTQIGLFERETRCPDNLVKNWYDSRKSILRGITESVYDHMKKEV